MPERVVITDSTYPDTELEREVLTESDLDLDLEVERVNASTPEDVIERAEGAVALLNQQTELTRAVFEALSDLAVVGRYGVGVDNVDLEAATDHGVAVVNVPDYCDDEVATHALSLLLACSRRLVRYDEHVKDGNWDWTVGRPIHRFTDGTLGLVAFGDIPRRLTELVSGFDLEVLAYDPYRDAESLEDAGVEKVSFEDLLERSDYVSVHAPLTDETRALFDADAFERMRETAILVNAARGPIVDVEALAEALEAGEIAGAGLDVMPEEPPESTSLFDRSDVVLSPHVAWYSEESIVTLRRSAAANVAAVLRGEQIPEIVNDLE